MPTLAGSGSQATSQPQTSQIRTRANKGLERVPTLEELMKANKDSLATAAHAREFLEKEGYAPPDARGCRAKLSYMLLLLLHAAPQASSQKGLERL